MGDHFIIVITASIASFGVGIYGGLFILRRRATRGASQILKEAEKQGEMLKKDKILQAKEKFLQLKYSKHTIYAILIDR